MVDGERQGNRPAVTTGGARQYHPAHPRGENLTTVRERTATANLVQALRLGQQIDPLDEAERQFTLGYAAGVLGLIRFHEIYAATMLTKKRA
jgi:hypothetical protein